MINVLPIASPADMETAFSIRRTVFVEEQHVSPEEEYDEYESISTHFLARTSDGTPCATARWRRTSEGVKMERFAVLQECRGQGVGKALVRAVLDNIFSQQPEPIERIYLHAQLAAMPLYAGFGFVPVGPMFVEADIQHYKMVLPGSAYVTQ
jgi:predicted GNAT family N-acyltransferase